MDEIHLSYGNSSIDLIKSKKLIALKPEPGREKKFLSVIKSTVRTPDEKPTEIGGFFLVNVEDTPRGVENELDTLRHNSTVAVGTHVFYSSDDEVPFVPTGQIYVVCADEVNAEDCQRLLENHKLEFVESRDQHEFIVQVTSASENPIKTAAALQQSPLISVAEPELATPGKLHPFVVPTDPLLTEQWHLRNTGFHRGTSFGFLQGADARVVEAWEQTQTLGSPDVVVAVIDDGFDLSHPDISSDGKLVAPRDFTRNSNNPILDPLKGDWHGTACAGVAIGTANGSGVVGAAPNCRLMPVRWGLNLADREIENWFSHVQNQGAWVVSCSWSAMARYFPLSTRAFRAIARCAQEGRNGLGCIICFAAGNENRNVNDPRSNSVNGFAIHPNVIAVAASTSQDQRADYSNYGREIAICAPSSGAGGWRITTSDVTGTYVDQNGQQREAGYSPGAYTNVFGGTSSACPLVAGICALILSIRPDLTSIQVKELIQNTARRIGDPASYDGQGHSVFFGYGCINAARAIETLREQ